MLINISLFIFKLKWYKTWVFYLFYVILDFLFLISLTGFTLAHFGQIYEGQENWAYGTYNVWWYLLASCHGYMSLMALAKILQ